MFSNAIAFHTAFLLCGPLCFKKVPGSYKTLEYIGVKTEYNDYVTEIIYCLNYDLFMPQRL